MNGTARELHHGFSRTYNILSRISGRRYLSGINSLFRLTSSFVMFVSVTWHLLQFISSLTYLLLITCVDWHQLKFHDVICPSGWAMFAPKPKTLYPKSDWFFQKLKSHFKFVLSANITITTWFSMQRTLYLFVQYDNSKTGWHKRHNIHVHRKVNTVYQLACFTNA